jgi:hypothetical protein
MRSDPSFEDRWERYTSGEFLKRDQAADDDYCAYARQFAEWTAELAARATQYADAVAINQAKVQLVDKYFEWRAYVPKAHRLRTGRRAGHTCIFHVFVEAYHALKVAELALTPPLLFLPETPPPPQIAGIFLGETDGA